MKRKKKSKISVIFFLIGIGVILFIGYRIYRKPYDEADKRNTYENNLIDDYLNDDSQNPSNEPENAGSDETPVEYQYSDVDDYTFTGSIDCILVIDKINLKKAVIRGNTLSDNDLNLSKYYFVTSDLTTTLSGNYIIYGHSSQTYGHSFNRLDEMAVGDTFYILQNKVRYDYRVEAVDRALRSESKPYFPNMAKRVTLVSCEKYLAPGYAQKRVIIVRAVQISSTAQ